jgi:hypothetical protein
VVPLKRRGWSARAAGVDARLSQHAGQICDATHRPYLHSVPIAVSQAFGNIALQPKAAEAHSHPWASPDLAFSLAREQLAHSDEGICDIERPPSYPSRTMDVDKCVELHNKILEHEWVHSGKSIEDFERLRQTWFEKYGDDAEAIRDLLSPNLTAPLERAYEIDYDGGHSFFYYVNGLFSPQIVHDQSDGLNEAWWQDGEEGALRQIVLYVMNYSFGSHPMGLV